MIKLFFILVIMIFSSKHVYQGLKINKLALSYRPQGRYFIGNTMYHSLKIMHRSLSMVTKRDNFINIDIDNTRDGSKITINSTDPITASLVQDIQGILSTLQVQDIINNQFNVENKKYTVSHYVRSNSGPIVDSTIIRDSIPDVTLDVSKSLSNMLLNHKKDKHITDKSTEVKDDDEDDDDGDDSDDSEPVELVNVDNKVKTHFIDSEIVKRQAQLIKNILGFDDFILDICICSDKKVRKLNAEFRDISKSTDVLSFPCNEYTAPERIIDDGTLQYGKLLGELYICPHYVHRSCEYDRKQLLKTKPSVVSGDDNEEEDAGVSLAMSKLFTVEERLPLLLIHGILHLLGHDHETEEDWQLMTTRENYVMEQFYKRYNQGPLVESEKSKLTGKEKRRVKNA